MYLEGKHSALKKTIKDLHGWLALRLILATSQVGYAAGERDYIRFSKWQTAVLGQYVNKKHIAGRDSWKLGGRCCLYQQY